MKRATNRILRAFGVKQLAETAGHIFEIRIEANGPRETRTDALDFAVDAAADALRAEGFIVTRRGYGVRSL